MKSNLGKLGKPLSRDEMKKIMGGNAPVIKCTVKSGSHTYSITCESGYTVQQCNLSGSAYCMTLRASGLSADFMGCSDGSTYV